LAIKIDLKKKEEENKKRKSVGGEKGPIKKSKQKEIRDHCWVFSCWNSPNIKIW